MSNVYLPLALCISLEQMKVKNEVFMCDFIFYLKNEIRTIFELDYNYV